MDDDHALAALRAATSAMLATIRVTDPGGSHSEPAAASVTIVDPSAPTANDTYLTAGKLGG